MAKYQEYLQYSLWTSDIKTKEIEVNATHKRYDPECIRGIWNASGSKGTFPVGVKKCTFDDYIELIVTGHSVKRIRDLDGLFQPSRFLFIDLDNDENEDVEEVELEALKYVTNNRIVFYPSTSGTPHRWHLYIETTNNMLDTDDLKRETFKIISELESVCKRKVTCDYKCYTSWYQVCYGMPQKEHYKLSIPEDTEFFCHQILKPPVGEKAPKIKRYETYELFMLSNTKKSSRILSEYNRLVPYNSKLLSKELNRPVLIDKSYSISPPFTYRRKKTNKGLDWRVQPGSRFKTAQAWILNLVPQWYKCNLKYGMGFSIEDLENTLTFLCKVNFKDFGSFNMLGALNGLSKLVEEYRGMPYDEIEKLSKGKIRKYRSSEHIRNTIEELIEEFKIDDHTLQFENRKALREAMKKYETTFRTAERRLKSLGYEVKLSNYERSDKGKTRKGPVYDFSKYPLNEKGQRLIPKDEMCQMMRNQACRLKIKLKSVK